MIIYVISLLTILLPAAGIIMLLRTRPVDRREWFLNCAAAFGPVLLTALAGSWGVIGHSLRHVPLVCYAATVLISFRRADFSAGRAARLDRWAASKLAAIILFFVLNIDLARGAYAGGDRLEMDFPLRGGEYLVYQGGASLVGNPFHAMQPGSRYALDIVKLDDRGRRAAGILPGDCADYMVYGEPVYSPLDATVLDARDGVRDNIPPAADEALGPGNHVLLLADGRLVLLAHFARGSVKVNKGDIVKRGQLLGRAGNSGNSLEPHLHIQAMKEGGTADAIPLSFKSMLYTINDIIIAE
ncbi:MAG: M23 family metallopeptidase [Spirochaetes bacterium]|nr:MAG: M23 family metallopeptidase [Spirochaetota bacterium]